MDSAAIERDRARHDDEERHDVGNDAADDHVEPRERVGLGGHALLDHRRLQIELHPGGYGGSDRADQHRDEGAAVVPLRHHRRHQHLLPGRVSQKAADGVGDIEDAGHQEDLLHLACLAARHQEVDQDRADRHRDLGRESEDLEARGDAGEFGDGVAPVADQHREQDPEGHADPVVLADQVRQPLAGDGPHARAHLLHDDQRQRDGDERPQQLGSELCARHRVGGDAAGVVVDVGGDDARPHHRQEQQEIPPAIVDLALPGDLACGRPVRKLSRHPAPPAGCRRW